MGNKMKAWYQTDIMKMEMRETEIPVPHGKQVQVKITCTGICGSDLHYLEHGHIGDFIVEYPFILETRECGDSDRLGGGCHRS